MDVALSLIYELTSIYQGKEDKGKVLIYFCLFSAHLLLLVIICKALQWGKGEVTDSFLKKVCSIEEVTRTQITLFTVFPPSSSFIHTLYTSSYIRLTLRSSILHFSSLLVYPSVLPYTLNLICLMEWRLTRSWLTDMFNLGKSTVKICIKLAKWN